MNDACIICESSEHIELARYSEPDIYEVAAEVSPKGYWRKWVKCSSCGLCYSQFSRSPDTFDLLYANGYRGQDAAWRGESAYERYQRIIGLPPDQLETHLRILWIKRQIQKLRNWPDSQRKLLDIGGASGVFAALFQDENWRSAVIDPAAEGRFIEAKLGIPYIEEPLEQAKCATEFDLVSMNYVLEHLRDPIGALKLAMRRMGADGLLYIEVPDASNFVHLNADHDIFNACHLWMFDESALSKCLERVGLSVISSQVLTVRRGHRGLMLLAEAKR